MSRSFVRPLHFGILALNMVATGCAPDDTAPSSEIAQHTLAAATAIPEIVEVFPANPASGELITITGSGFGSERGASWAAFHGDAAVDFIEITNWTDTEITG